MAEPVALSPTKPMALMSGCSVSALAGLFAVAVHRIHHAGRQPRLVHQAHQQIGGDGRPLGRLVHDRAAGCERRCDLPGRQHERRVPRRDDADRADRHARRHVPVVGGRQVEAVARIRHAVGEEAEVLGGADGGLRHEAIRLAGVPALQHGDVAGVRLDGVGNPVQQGAALGRVPCGPGLEGRLGCGGRAIDVGGCAARDLGDQRFVDRRDGVECRLAIDALAGDRVADAVGAELCQQRLEPAEVAREALVSVLAHQRSCNAIARLLVSFPTVFVHAKRLRRWADRHHGASAALRSGGGPHSGFIHATGTTSPGFSRSTTLTALWESILTASTSAVAAPTTRRLTALTASTLFLTATWYCLTPEGPVTVTVQPNACSLMHGTWQPSPWPTTLSSSCPILRLTDCRKPVARRAVATA